MCNTSEFIQKLEKMWQILKRYWAWYDSFLSYLPSAPLNVPYYKTEKMEDIYLGKKKTLKSLEDKFS